MLAKKTGAFRGQYKW